MTKKLSKDMDAMGRGSREEQDRKHKTSFTSEEMYSSFDRDLVANVVAEGRQLIGRLFVFRWCEGGGGPWERNKE